MSDENKENLPAVQKVAPVPIVNGSFAPNDMDGLWRLSGLMSQSGLMPADIKTREQVFVCVQMGFEVGISPMQAVQNIAPINGRPAMWGDLQLALVRSSKYLDDFEEVIKGEGEDMVAICTAKRKGLKTPTVNTFSVADARRAKLWGKAGPWTQYPQRMLKLRARSWTLRDLFGDVLKGIPQAEEMMDVVEMKQASSETYEAKQVKEIDTTAFDNLSAKENYPSSEMLEIFLFDTASANDMTIDAVKSAAAEDFISFWENFEAWAKENKHQRDAEVSAENEAKSLFDEGMINIEELRKKDSKVMDAAWMEFVKESGADPKTADELELIMIRFDEIAGTE